MATRVRNSDWQEDQNMKDDLIKYVRQNLRRKEILDSVQIKYPTMHGALVLSLVDSNISASSLRIIAWIFMMYAKLLRKRWTVPAVYSATELLLLKICEVHGLSVPRNLVYAMMTEVNPQGLEERRRVGKPISKRPQRKNSFISNVSKPKLSF